MQTQHHQVDGGHQLAFGLRVFAAGSVDADQLDAGHAAQTLPNLQAGGAGLAVDENLGHESS